MSDDLTHDGFSVVLGETFRLVPPADMSEPFDVELIRVRSFEATDVTKREQPFAIEFRGPNDKQLSQGMWHLEHPTLGANEIFLVPVGPDEKGLCYEAVFN